MDLYSFNINSANELRLRRHIRDILLPYARTHLTSNHVAFTEKSVEELLLQTLEYVPMADATSFLLPTEPFQVLMRSLDSLDLSLPEESWVTPAAHIRYLRSFFPPPLDPQDLQTEKCWHEEDRYMKLSLTCRPISSPILSERARRETPKLGSTNYRASFPRTNSTLTTFLGLDTLSVSSIEDLPTPPADDVLDLRLELDSATATRAFLQSVLVPSMKEKPVDCFGDTPNVPEFLNHYSPFRFPPSLNSPPLFPRVAQGFSNVKNGVYNPTRVPDLAPMLQVASPELIDGEDGDISGHHMEVVSGWTTLTFSSPPPPSLHSSDRSEVDELWNISPPGTPATSLMAAKMDDVEIPRIRRFGHKNTLADENTNHSGTADLLMVEKSPGFFITSFISAPIPMTQVHKPITSQLECAKSGMHSPHPLSPGQNASDSLLGQPPSVLEEPATGVTSAGLVDFVEDLEQRFDDTVASIYAPTPQDPLSYIREEKLDDKDIMLMDVPNLPPPTAHPRESALFPEGMQTLVTPKGDFGWLDTASHGGNGFVFLRPIKGIKPLTLDLSWRPFNFGKTIPTNEEVIGIAKSIQPEDEVQGYRDEKYERDVQVLLDLWTAPPPAKEAQLTLNPNVPRGCEEFGTSPALKRAEESGHIDYLLTQRERLRVSGAKTTLDTEVEAQDTEQRIALWARASNDGFEIMDMLVRDENLHQHAEYQGSRDSFDLNEYRPQNLGSSFDDSGIDMMGNNVGQSPTSELAVPHLLHPLQHDLPYAADTLEANKENVSQSENKENVPPWDVDDYQPTNDQSDPMVKQYDWSSYFEFPEPETPSFEPLSFASQSQLLRPSDDVANSTTQNVAPPTSSGLHAGRPEVDLAVTREHEQTNSRIIKRRKLDDLVLASSKDLFATFIGLRNQATSSRDVDDHSEARNDTPTPHQTQDVPEQIPPRVAPDDVFDRHTVRLPELWVPTAGIHRYLVSMALIQKRALVHELQGDQCRIILAERYDLGGTDIIIDPDYGVLFIPLLALPANIESAIERISGESWRYSSLLIVFEAFPSAQSYRVDRSRVTRPAPYAYTPPICKAIKKLRRNIGIAEGCGTMSPECTVTWAFANNVEEAAKFVRCFGEEACAISVERGRGMLWDEREWLEEEEREGETDLAGVHGMNAFAAFVMLYNRSLETILELSPEVRLAEFGPVLGQERMMGLNAVIESRLRQLAPDIADSVVDPVY